MRSSRDKVFYGKNVVMKPDKKELTLFGCFSQRARQGYGMRCRVYWPRRG